MSINKLKEIKITYNSTPNSFNIYKEDNNNLNDANNKQPMNKEKQERMIYMSNIREERILNQIKIIEKIKKEMKENSKNYHKNNMQINNDEININIFSLVNNNEKIYKEIISYNKNIYEYTQPLKESIFGFIWYNYYLLESIIYEMGYGYIDLNNYEICKNLFNFNPVSQSDIKNYFKMINITNDDNSKE